MRKNEQIKEKSSKKEVGDGKTSLLIFVEDYINERKNKSGKWEEYDLAVYADFEESIKKLASFPEFHSTVELWKLEYSIDDIITALIYIEIMREMEKQEFDVPTDVKTYLQSDSLRNIIDSFVMNPKIRDLSVPFTTLSVVWETLFTPNFDKAKRALKSYITSNKYNILVLIDSFDNYNMRTFEYMTLVKQLIRQAFEFSINKKQTGINVKVAMPYEVYSGVLSPIIAKNQGNTTTLQWMYKELVRMVALKLCSSYKHGRLKGNALFNFCEDFQLSDFYSDQGASSYVKSQELLHNILPERYKAILDFSLPTLMYAIRHTTLKPREVLYVFDQIIKTIIEKNDALYFINTKPEEISIIVHKCMHHILNTILEMYDQTYNVDLSKIIQVLFEEENFMLMGSEIRSLIIRKWKDLEDIIRNSYRVSGYDDATSVINELLGEQGTGRNARLETIMLESGIIGGVNDIRTLPPNSEPFDNKDMMYLIIGDYGKDFGHSRIMAGTRYVLHPLCFELFGCLYDKRVKVLQSNSGEKDWLNLIIRTQN